MRIHGQYPVKPLEPLAQALGLPFLLLIVCIILAVRVWRLEKKLK